MLVGVLKVIMALFGIILGATLIWLGLSGGWVVYDPTDVTVMSGVLIAIGYSMIILGAVMIFIFDVLPWQITWRLLSALVGAFLLWSGANPELSWVGVAQVLAPIFVMMIGAVAFLPLILAVGDNIPAWRAKRRQ